MDATDVRLGETGFEALLDWLRETGQPQTIEGLTYQYVSILRGMILEEDEGAEEEA